MKFVEYCNCAFQEAKMKESLADLEGKMDIMSDAEMKAIHFALGWYRTFLKFMLLPWVMFRFFLVKSHMIRQPEPVITNRIKEQKRAEEEAKRVVDKLKEGAKELASGAATPDPS